MKFKVGDLIRIKKHKNTPLGIVTEVFPGDNNEQSTYNIVLHNNQKQNHTFFEDEIEPTEENE